MISNIKRSLLEPMDQRTWVVALWVPGHEQTNKLVQQHVKLEGLFALVVSNKSSEQVQTGAKKNHTTRIPELDQFEVNGWRANMWWAMRGEKLPPIRWKIGYSNGFNIRAKKDQQRGRGWTHQLSVCGGEEDISWLISILKQLGDRGIVNSWQSSRSEENALCWGLQVKVPMVDGTNRPSHIKIKVGVSQNWGSSAQTW